MPRGRKLSITTKRKISHAQKGSKNSMYGRHHKPGTKQKLKRLFSGKKNPMYGKRHSAATRRKISLAAKRRYAQKLKKK